MGKICEMCQQPHNRATQAKYCLECAHTRELELERIRRNTDASRAYHRNYHRTVYREKRNAYARWVYAKKKARREANKI